jgi:hypothetical protein
MSVEMVIGEKVCGDGGDGEAFTMTVSGVCGPGV